MRNPITRFVRWIRLGYPTGVPANDHNALIALLRRQLTDEEVVQVCRELRAEQLMPLDTADIGVWVMKTTNEMPAANDIDRVRSRLEAKGWPVEDAVVDLAPSGGEGDGPTA